MDKLSEAIEVKGGMGKGTLRGQVGSFKESREKP
jgi:hypothetical protein